MTPFLVADLGNTSVKLGLVEEGRVRRVERLAWWEGDPPRRPDGFPATLVGVAYVSVRPTRDVAFERFVRERLGHAALRFGRDFPCPLEIRCACPESVGADRLANAVAARARHPRGALVLDLGTAFTIDVVGPEGEFLGGAIGPGVRTALEALRRSTDQLPRVDPALPGRALGQGTEEAIRSGVLLGLAGALEGLIARIRRELPFEPAVVATGGDAPLLRPELPSVEELVPHLTLEGVWRAATASVR